MNEAGNICFRAKIKRMGVSLVLSDHSTHILTFFAVLLIEFSMIFNYFSFTYLIITNREGAKAASVCVRVCLSVCLFRL